MPTQARSTLRTTNSQWSGRIRRERNYYRRNEAGCWHSPGFSCSSGTALLLKWQSMGAHITAMDGGGGLVMKTRLCWGLNAPTVCLIAASILGFTSGAEAGGDAGEKASETIRPYTYGIQPTLGQTSSELNRALVAGFGAHPYGRPLSPEDIELRRASEAETRNITERELRLKLEAKKLRATLAEKEELARSLRPSRRYIGLAATIKNPELYRDRLESMVARGELSIDDLLDAEQGRFDRSRSRGRRAYDGYGFAVDDRIHLSDRQARMLEVYSRFARAEQFARDLR